MNGSIDTKKAERRELLFGGREDLAMELDRLEAAHAAGTLRTSGNWTAAQGLEHCARVWAAAMDGFPEGARPPGWLKLAAKLFFRRAAVAGKTAPAGMKPPAVITDHFEPGPEVAFDDAMAHLRGQLERTRRGERFSKPSPLFGELTHDEWLRLQLGHCQLHLGFMHPG
ncbi:MAG: DUF1569 domain-containing protein [Planctomycetota bacterium]